MLENKRYIIKSRYYILQIILFVIFCFTINYSSFANSPDNQKIYFYDILEISNSSKVLIVNSNEKNANVYQNLFDLDADVFPNISLESITEISVSNTKFNFVIGNKHNWRNNLTLVHSISYVSNDKLHQINFDNCYIPSQNLKLFANKVIIDNNFNDNLDDEINDNPTKSFKDYINKSNLQEYLLNNTNSKSNRIQNSEPIDYKNVLFSTYIGGGDYDYPTGITIDKDSNIIVTGYTSSKNFPTSTGSYKKDSRISKFGESDVFISKFDKSGNLLVCTYFGSFVDDRATDIKVNSLNQIVITGYVYQTSTFPVTSSSYDTTANGFYDCFVSVFDNNLTTLIYSTLIGGRKDDYPMSLEIDVDDNIYITGYTTELENRINDSLPYPVTTNVYEKVYRGKYDVFVSKLSKDLSTLSLSTLFGGNKDDFALDIKITQSGSILITGFTKSDNLPVTGDAFQFRYNDTIEDSSMSDAFVLKLSSNFDILLYSSYFGGVGRDGAYSIETDLSENIYITGFTESSNFPVTIGSYADLNNKNPASRDNSDSFITKLENSGRNVVFSTIVGGEFQDRAYDLKLNNNNDIIIVGYTISLDFPNTDFAFDKQIVNQAKTDGFIYKINNTGSDILFSSFYGGEENDICKSIVYFGTDTSNSNNKDIIGLIGSTTSTNFVVSEFGFDKEYNDTSKTDSFVSLLKLQDNPIINYDYNVCEGNSVQIISNLLTTLDTVNNTYTYSWFPNLNLDNNLIAKPTSKPNQNIFYILTITDQISNLIYDTINIRVVKKPNPLIAGNVIGIKLKNANFNVKYNPQSTYIWVTQNAAIINGQTTNSIQVTFNSSDTAKVYVIENNSFGCSDTSDVFEILLYDITKPKILIISGTIPRCSLDTLILNSGPFFDNVVWSNGSTDNIIKVTGAGKFSFKASNLLGDIVFSDTVNVTTIQSPPKPQLRLTGLEYRCLTQANSYQWYFEDILIIGATDRRYTATQLGIHKVKITSDNGCKNYSDNLTTSIASEENKDIVVYENFDNKTILKIQNEYLGEIILNIYNLLGQSIESKAILKNNGLYEVELFEPNTNLSQNTSYIVVINFVSINEFNTLKFIK